MAGEYSCIRGTKKMAFRLFMEMEKTGAFNAYVIWTKKNHISATFATKGNYFSMNYPWN